MTSDSHAGTAKALEGIRMPESGRFFAAPLVRTLLGDMGAEVIRYEEPDTSDPLRHGHPPLIDGRWHA